MGGRQLGLQLRSSHMLGEGMHRSQGAGGVCYHGRWDNEVGACVPLEMSLSHVTLSSFGSEKPTAGKPGK